MEIFNELNEKPNLSLALGYFDGVHSGHKAVIQNAVNYAKQNNNKSAVITFSDHPYCYLRGVCPKYILTRDQRRKKIQELGIDYMYELDFEQIYSLTAQDYLKNILIKYFQPTAISTGWNHSFGSKKSGNIEYLAQNSKNFGYKYFAISPKELDSEIISSTTIRKLLTDGAIKEANDMLGYKFTISGNIIKGNQIGRTIGFKTANITYPPELIELPYGVYSVETNFGCGIANFGIRPTIQGSEAILEVHILNFNKDIYGENITVKFNKMIRAEKKFSSLDELKKQIKQDIYLISA